MKNQKNLRTIVIVASIWLGFMMVNSLMSAAAVKTIPYSDFLRLAKEGKVFSNTWAQPFCSPTRASILTGLSPARIGITTPACHMPQVVLKATPGHRWTHLSTMRHTLHVEVQSRSMS